MLLLNYCNFCFQCWVCLVILFWFKSIFCRLFQQRAHTAQVVAPAQPQINVGQATSPLCPYKAWNHYFPMEDYTLVSPTVQRIQVFVCMFISFSNCFAVLLLTSTTVELIII